MEPLCWAVDPEVLLPVCGSALGHGVLEDPEVLRPAQPNQQVLARGDGRWEEVRLPCADLEINSWGRVERGSLMEKQVSG